MILRFGPGMLHAYNMHTLSLLAYTINPIFSYFEKFVQSIYTKYYYFFIYGAWDMHLPCSPQTYTVCILFVVSYLKRYAIIPLYLTPIKAVFRLSIHQFYCLPVCPSKSLLDPNGPKYKKILATSSMTQQYSMYFILYLSLWYSQYL